jgi:hypothetical protein
MKTRTQLALATIAVLAAMTAQAQTIERMKMTDGDLTCQQMYDEIKLMDMMAAQSAAQPAAAAPAPSQDNQVGAQVAGAVAQTAVAHAAARGGWGWGGGSAGGALGGLFGGLAQAAAQQQAQAPAPAPAATGNPALAAQAAGRKEHLTGLFLGKSCKMSDMR